MPNQSHVIMRLRRLVNSEGLRAFCTRTGLDKGYVSRVINGRQEPGPAVLEVLGFERVVTYRSLE